MFVLGLIKVLDNVLMTAKSITTYQNKKIASSLLVIINQFMFYFIVKSIVSDNSTLSTIVVCICSGIGTYIAMVINDRLQKDATYTNILTCSDDDSIDDLCDMLLKNKIKYIPVDSYNRRNEKTKTILIFSQTKYESTLIDDYLKNSETKYLRQVLH